MLSVQSGPTAIGYNAFNEDIYVLNGNSSSVTVINTTNNLVNQTILTGSDPAGILFVPYFNHDILVANQGSNTISVIDPNNIVTNTIQVGAQPSEMTFNMFNHDVYVVTSDSVEAINSSFAVVATFNYSAVGGIAYDRANHDIFFSDASSNSVVAVNATNQIATVILVGHGPHFLVFDNSSGDVYVSNLQSETISAINSTNQVVATIPVGAGALYMVANLDNGELYAINSVNGSVTAINTTANQVISNISLGAGAEPTTAAYDEVDDLIYIPLLDRSSVLVISSSNQIVGQLSTGIAPTQVFYDSINFELYVVNSGSNSVTVYPT
jgi:YVTN family beta-propeller protein